MARRPCYRKEAGGCRLAEGGTLRGHRLDQVGLFRLARPAVSDAALRELPERAERMVTDLGLHQRITEPAARDTSAARARTYDVEVWLPGLGTRAEAGSVSDARDHRARPDGSIEVAGCCGAGAAGGAARAVRPRPALHSSHASHTPDRHNSGA